MTEAVRTRTSDRVSHLLGVLVLVVAMVSGCGRASAHGRPSAQTPVTSFLAHRPFYVAHRGGDEDWPEGTAYAYHEAVGWSAGLALEMPVRRTVDGVWVVSHDPTTGRVFGRNLNIATSRWADLAALRSLRGRLPLARLQHDVLDVVPRTRVLFIDDEDPPTAATLLRLLTGTAAHHAPSSKATGGRPQCPRRRVEPTTSRGGFYYAAGLRAQPGALTATQRRFDLLGIDGSAPAADFRAMRRSGKPLIAHIVATRPAAQRALSLAASGLMVSGVTAVVPHTHRA